MRRRGFTPRKLPGLGGAAVRATDRGGYGRLEDVAAGAVVERRVLADVRPLVALALRRGGVRTPVGAATLGNAHGAGELHAYARIKGRFAKLFLDQVLRSINSLVGVAREPGAPYWRCGPVPQAQDPLRRGAQRRRAAGRRARVHELLRLQRGADSVTAAQRRHAGQDLPADRQG